MVKPLLVASWSQPSKELNIKNLGIGGKAEGLFSIPQEWVPPFVAFTSSFSSTWLSSKSAAKAFALMNRSEVELLNELMRLAQRQITGQYTRLLVRSSSYLETGLISKGRFVSQVVSCDLDALISGIDEVMSISEFSSMNVLVQVCIEPNITGHLSNERRVTHRLTDWLLEVDSPIGSLGKPMRIRAHFTATKPGILMASSEKQLASALKRIASHLLTERNGRFHCEWVWNGRQVWIVQADPIAEEKPEKYMQLFDESSEEVLPAQRTSFRVLRHFSELNVDKWIKLDCPRHFVELGLPVADVYLLPGEKWADSRDTEHRGLGIELLDLCKVPVVVRTDIAKRVQHEANLLPTSPPSKDPLDLIQFMETVANQFHAKGLNDDQWTFLFSRLVPANASALVQARPQGKVVWIDALWGFPDGLLFFPHDSYRYRNENGSLQVSTQFKGLCISFQDKRWVCRPVSPPFDWKSVLSSSECHTLALWAQRIADNLSNEVQLMALSQINGQRGARGCLPWHYTVGPIPASIGPDRLTFVSSGVRTIHSWEDLERLKHEHTSSLPRGIRLRPESDLIRNTNFLREVAAFAGNARMPIFFEGSLLGHAYYILAEAGAPVVVVGVGSNKEKVKTYNKLVRDGIPAIIRRAGGIARVQTLSRSLARTLLAHKLVEEALEVLYSSEPQMAEELADVLEVLEALRDQSGLSSDQLAEIQKKKRLERGGFKRLSFLKDAVEYSQLKTSEAKGSLPLLLDDGSPEDRSKKAKKTESSIILTKDADGAYIIKVPIIPPVRDDHISRQEVHTHGQLIAETQYKGNEIVIKIKEGQSPTVVPTEQLNLFPEDL